MRDALVQALASAERGGLIALHAIGLAPDAHGQPGWPFAHRLALETLAIDGGLARQAALALACTVAALLSLVVGASARRFRLPAGLAAIALGVVAPWPSPGLLLADATPTSFHRSPSGFRAGSIDRGLALFSQHCSGCHGDDGHGEGPRAAGLPVWPPRLDGALLWRRADGETFWRLAHGLVDRRGAPTMPGFAPPLDDDSLWALIDGMKALAAGSGMRRDAAWLRPVAAPDAPVRCGDDADPRTLASYRGQRLRLVALAPGVRLPAEDPRVVTIALVAAGAPPAGCAIVDAPAWRAYARVAGLEDDDLAGTQLIVDRDGWLRALGRAGRPGWTRNDLLCRSPAAAPPAPPGADGLGDLIATMDADPILGRDSPSPHRPRPGRGFE